MKYIGLILTSAILTLTSCSKESEKVIETRKKDPFALRYDSLDWRADFKAKKSRPEEINQYKNQVAKFYKDFWVDGKVSGGFLVAKNGEIIFEQYQGMADLRHNREIKQNTPIHIASISKVFTSMAILKLVEKKKIKLDQKVNTILEGFPYDDITIRNLLNHRSGLPNYANVLWNGRKAMMDREKPISNQDVLNIFAEHNVKQIRPADKGFYYSNTNFAFLALVIEKITKMPYPKAMKYMVFDPLEMENTFVFEYDRDKDTVARSYKYNGYEWAWDDFDRTYGDKNIYSTPRDLFKLDIAMYSDDFLPRKIKKEAFKGYSYEQKGYKNYGLGMRMLEYDNGKKLLYHNGWWHGNNTVFVHDVNNQFTVIALGNKQNKNIYAAFRLAGLTGTYPMKVPSKDSLRIR
ncbi:CubicO group peptidase, beta-lactamase class C family [Chishuiella changwenlii]|uniref:CubicO group peptidase, beta-lactamase class C family n=1 Tax=Chishuiella changwenlii TaxID=1434701 RepID=A0A1M6W902_9FLAO|nr:serine hydrolase domain-containing protein [Chishuiella changwenlii]GGE88646.1 penicillin-binding protein [Chishuiella changwenlii]SHK89975.1 CubicO group peptidase, beta-lactamase class C family [Chishuiella changwenlii]